MQFRVTVNGGKPYTIEAANSFEAWDMAFAANSDADRIEVELPVNNKRPMVRTLREANTLQAARLASQLREPVVDLNSIWSTPPCGN